jgi:hypothetical protein
MESWTYCHSGACTVHPQEPNPSLCRLLAKRLRVYLPNWLIVFGGPCRGRTYGPLIKSERKGMTQVFEDLGHPLVIPADHQPHLLILAA